MSAREAAIQVLTEAGEPLHAEEIRHDRGADLHRHAEERRRLAVHTNGAADVCASRGCSRGPSLRPGRQDAPISRAGDSPSSTMLFALDPTAHTRQRATPGKKGLCPTCKGDVLAKCGSRRIWHWAHRQVECDHWSETETEWHAGWKSCFPEDRCEVAKGKHRADIVTPTGYVIELQHSSLSEEEVCDREEFYGRMVWVLDAEPFIANLGLEQHEDSVHLTWRRRRRRKVCADHHSPVWLVPGVLSQSLHVTMAAR
jgi:hypothetical protein